MSLIIGLMTISCIDEMQFNPSMQERDALIIVPRVKSFANQYVTKSSPYADYENKISSLSILVFDNDGNNVHIMSAQGDNLSSITINKSMINIPPDHKNNLDKATIVMIANVSLDNIYIYENEEAKSISEASSLTLTHMESSYIANPQPVIIAPLTENFSGFPMLGGKSEVNLSPSTEPQDPIEIGLEILYAKSNFSISVAEGTENEVISDAGLSFKLNGCSVNNVSAETTLAKPSDATVSQEYTSEGTSITTSGTTSLNGSPLTFTFYLAETRYNHNSDLTGIYPDDWLTVDAAEDVKNYNGTTDQDKLNGVKYFYDDLIQQYKPKLAANSPDGLPAAGLATYVLLNGTYTDYRGTAWDVNYKVYLGKDNAQNFHVDRNSEYTNYITIKGIRNNDSYGEGQVWVDHRVNVSYPGTGADDHVAITRETLIDSHIEVRPLRVQLGEDFVGVRVYLPTKSDGTLVDWIGIERFTGENCQESTTYCYQIVDGVGKSTGKRKYFTTSLISELQSKEGEYGVNEDKDSGRKYIYLLDGECAWIYFDENATSDERPATIELAFYPASGDPTPEAYQIKQHGLQTVGGYTIESYEEYLHSFDSYDTYNLSTGPIDYTQQGLAWDAGQHMFSKDIIVSATPLDGLQDNIDAGYRYDYFHEDDIPDGESYYPYIKNGSVWETANYGTGLTFTDRACINADITIKDMGTVPETAYQYCLSKNKFNEDADGNHTLDIHWYLPDVHELQAVLGADPTAEDFVSDAYYWSSQPTNNGFSFELFGYEFSLKNESPDNARAVSTAGSVDLSRKAQNRIRCFYSAEGLTTDMKDRTPDGIGGVFNFYMKAYNGTSPAYFNYMLPDATRNTVTNTDNYDYNNSSYPYPTFANPGSYFGYFNNVVDGSGNAVEGFGKYPLSTTNWSPHEDDASYYYALNDFPGLSAFELEELVQWLTGQGAYRPTSTKKSDTKTVTTENKRQLDRTLPTASLNTLDHLTGGQMFNISFSSNINTSNAPTFNYLENEAGSNQVTTTRYWQVPTYALSTYAPKAEEDEEEFVGEATVTETRLRGFYDGAAETVRNQADADALALAKANAAEKYPNRTYTYGEPKYSRKETQNPNTAWGREYSREFTCTTTCTITIKCTATASPVTYWEDATGGGWDAGTSSTNSLEGIQTDELKIYSGNSFTISLTDAYKDTHEITKVKVYYSGDNLVGTDGLLNEDKRYARFVDSMISLPQTETIPKGGSTETLQLDGMDYNENHEDRTGGSHQWSGNGRNSVTLVLVDYYINNDIRNNNYTYKYSAASWNFNHPIVIDRIEIKCTPKSTE